MFDRTLTAIVAIGLALVVWVYARSRDQEVLDHVPIPVEVSLTSAQGDQFILEFVGTPQVQASFSGPPSRIRELRGLLQRDKVRVELTCTVPEDRLKENRVNESLLVEPSDIHVPSGVTTTLVAGRNQVRVLLHRLGEKRLPVRFDSALAPNAGQQVTLKPDTVLVRGPQEVLDRASVLMTQPAVLGSSLSKGTSVPLLRELEGRAIHCEPEEILVRANPPAPKKTYGPLDVSVHFLTPAGFAYRPRFANDRAGKLTLRVQGPVQDDPPRLLLYVDLTSRAFADTPARNPLRPNWYEEPLQSHIPRGFQLLDELPRSITFELVPLEDAPSRLDVSRPEMP